MLRRASGLFTAIAAMALVHSPAAADERPQTRLVSCGKEPCLLVSGRRDHGAQTVSLNGKAVSVEGERGWRVLLPMATVRALCQDGANGIAVTVSDALTGQKNELTARLPIGLLGDSSRLQSIEVTAS